MSKLDWNNLKYFLAVARTGGLTPAAVQLKTSASTVSRHIDAMEATLDMRLFLRQQRGYLLTDEGSSILEQVIEVERAMQSVERQGAAVAEIAGEVKLATLESIAHYLLMPDLPAFNYINNIVVLTPGILKLRFYRTIVQCNQCFSAMQLTEEGRIF